MSIGTLRVSEYYPSVQGEGPRVGYTTVFVRFGGCNLKCPGWPCDTQHAIDPQFRKEWKQWDPEALGKAVITVAKHVGARMITLTGGEPFLQQNGALEVFVRACIDAGLYVECFSNGRLLYPQWAIDNIMFIIDWKMPGSGEYLELDIASAVSTGTDQRVPEPFEDNLLRLQLSRHKSAVKFVCLNLADFNQAVFLWSSLDPATQVSLDWFYGKVWGDLGITDAELVEQAMLNKLPWRLNVQLHNYIWDPQERGR